MDKVHVILTESEAEIVMLAVDIYRRHHIHEYDEECRKEALADIAAILGKLR